MLAFWTRGFPCQGTGKENLWCPEYPVPARCLARRRVYPLAAEEELEPNIFND